MDRVSTAAERMLYEPASGFRLGTESTDEVVERSRPRRIHHDALGL